MKIQNFGTAMSEPGRLFYNVLHDLDKRPFLIGKRLELFHIVNRGSQIIRTVGAAKEGLHFGIRKIHDREKGRIRTTRRVEADFMLVGMTVQGFDIDESSRSRRAAQPLNAGWPQKLYLAVEDRIETPVMASDVPLISRAIAEGFLRAMQMPERDIAREIEYAFEDLNRVNFNGEWA